MFHHILSEDDVAEGLQCLHVTEDAYKSRRVESRFYVLKTIYDTYRLFPQLSLKHLTILVNHPDWDVIVRNAHSEYRFVVTVTSPRVGGITVAELGDSIKTAVEKAIDSMQEIQNQYDMA